MKFEFKIYDRVLTGLKTSRGEHRSRKGILIRLWEGDAVAFGEIAPWTGFAVETLDIAARFCRSLEGNISAREILSIPRFLPCTQCAFSSALMDLEDRWDDPFSPVHVTGLLPAGYDALAQAAQLAQEGFRSVKWKIGAHPWEEEKAVAEELWALAKKENLQIRLDANGALDDDTLRKWMSWLEQHPCEFLEQPLPASQFREIKLLAQQQSIPLALDESLCAYPSFSNLPWAGIWVIKPSLVGNLPEFLTWATQHPKDWVVSSTFETSIGFETVLKTASALDTRRPAGLGTLRFFPEDGYDAHTLAPTMQAGNLTLAQAEAIWQNAG